MLVCLARVLLVFIVLILILIDIVIYGSLDEKTLDRIFTLLNDSNLPVKVDVQSYDLITYPPLKEHIDANMLLLFTHDQFEEN